MTDHLTKATPSGASDDGMNDDGSELAALRALLLKSNHLGPSPEKLAREARMQLRINATRVNAWSPPEPDKASEYWVVVLSPRAPEGCLNYTMFMCGLDLESVEPDFVDSEGNPARSWRSFNLKAGVNWLPVSHFEGALPDYCKSSNWDDMLAHGALHVVPPGASIPAAALTGAELRAIAEHAMLNDRDVKGLRFTANLLPQGELKNQLLSKAQQLTDNRTVLTV